MNIFEWVRQRLRARRSKRSVKAGRKLDAIRTAAGHEFPTADIAQMLEEIERGYPGDVRAGNRGAN